MAHNVDPLAGCRAKVERAHEELRRLNDEVPGFGAGSRLRDNHTYEITREIEAETGEEVHRLKVLRPLPLTRWGIAVGIVVHLCRSSLDNLVEVLTEVHTGHPLPRTEFPIFDRAEDFGLLTRKGEPAKSSGLYRIRGIAPAAAEIIEQLQPYNASNQLDQSALWALHKLSNIDKHRAPSVVGTAALVSSPLPGDGISVSAIIQNIIPFDDDAEVMRFESPPDGRPSVEMDYEFDVQIAFHGGPAHGREVTNALRHMILAANGIIEKLARFA